MLLFGISHHPIILLSPLEGEKTVSHIERDPDPFSKGL
jgi:hypothetical protein